MNVAALEKEIRGSIEIGNPWAVDDLIEEYCGDHGDLKMIVMQIVADEYRKRLRKMSREELLRRYQQCFEEQDDANKDWLLGEIAEEIIQEN